MNIPFTGLKRQYANLREEILDVTDQVLTSGHLMNDAFTHYFEEWLADKNHSRHAVLCHSGTQALEILANYYCTFGFMPDQPTILIPSMTFPASANAFINAGWNVHFVDTNAYGNMNLDLISDEYDAVLAIGLYGAALPNKIRKYPTVIEDAAQHWLSDNCTRMGNGSAISFDPMKNLNNYGNGGAVVTNNINLADYARNWIDNGKLSGHAEIGSNSRMSEVDCAQMMIKTRHLDAWQERRKQIALRYIEAFKHAPFRCLIDDTNVFDHSFHKFVIDIDSRDQVQEKLKQAGIDTRVHYKHPLHELPAYQRYQGPNMLSAASSLSRRALSLPIYPELTDNEVEYIIKQVLTIAS